MRSIVGRSADASGLLSVAPTVGSSATKRASLDANATRLATNRSKAARAATTSSAERASAYVVTAWLVAASTDDKRHARGQGEPQEHAGFEPLMPPDDGARGCCDWFHALARFIHERCAFVNTRPWPLVGCDHGLRHRADRGAQG